MAQQNMAPDVTGLFGSLDRNAFLEWLEVFRCRMKLDTAALLPGRNVPIDAIGPGSIDKILRFFLPHDALPLWHRDTDAHIDTEVYAALDTFLDSIYMEDTVDLLFRWSKALREQARKRLMAEHIYEPAYVPSDADVENALRTFAYPIAVTLNASAAEDEGIARFLQACGIQTPLSERGDEDIYLALGVLLYQIYRLPCSRDDLDLRASYRQNLLSKLAKILQSDWRKAMQEAIISNPNKLSAQVNRLEIELLNGNINDNREDSKDMSPDIRNDNSQGRTLSP